MEPETSAMPTSESSPARLVDDQSKGDGLNITRYFDDHLVKGDGDLIDIQFYRCARKASASEICSIQDLDKQAACAIRISALCEYRCTRSSMH